MTYKKWEKQLKKHLSTLSWEEKEDALEYYRELYEDKREAGEAEEAIVEEFGFPETCAERILNETEKAPRKKRRKKGGASPAQIVGMVFLTILVLCPLAEIAIAVIASCAAVTVAGGAAGIAGVIYVLLSFTFGLNGGALFAHIGLGIAASGIGLLLFAGFYYATKYTVLGCIRALKFLYKRR